MRRQLSTGAVIAAITLAVGSLTPSAQAPTFDFDTGNAGIEVIIPAVIPALFQTTTPNDAPIILRHTTVITNAWFDAIAPYHPTAMGVYSRLGRRPPAEAATNRQKNIAMLYASYRVLNSMLPRFAANWRQCLCRRDSIRTTRARTSRQPLVSETWLEDASPRSGSGTA